jgi:hypothetical protein
MRHGKEMNTTLQAYGDVDGNDCTDEAEGAGQKPVIRTNNLLCHSMKQINLYKSLCKSMNYIMQL